MYTLNKLTWEIPACTWQTLTLRSLTWDCFLRPAESFQRESQNLSYCLDSSLVCKWRPRYSLDTQPGDPASTTVYLQYVLQHKNQKTLRYPSHHRWRGPQTDHRILSTVPQFLFVPDSLEKANSFDVEAVRCLKLLISPHCIEFTFQNSFTFQRKRPQWWLSNATTNPNPQPLTITK